MTKQYAQDAVGRAAQALTLSASVSALNNDLTASEAKITQAMDLKYGGSEQQVKDMISNYGM